MPYVVYISAHEGLGFPGKWTVATVRPPEVPHQENLDQADYILVAGVGGDAEWATQVAGVIRRRVEVAGATLIVAYERAIEGSVEVILGRFGIVAERLNTPAPVRAVEQSFDEYFEVFGISASEVGDEGLDVLGRGDSDATGVFTASIAGPRGNGSIYVVPYYFAGAQQGDFMRLLLGAIQNHRADAGEATPEFLGDLRLPGEAEILAETAEVEAKLEELQSRAKRLERYRLLMGPRATGQALEDLIIESLMPSSLARTFERRIAWTTGSKTSGSSGRRATLLLLRRREQTPTSFSTM